MVRKIGFIGTGNMGTALIKAVTDLKFVLPENIYAYDICFEKLESINKEHGVNIVHSISSLVEEVDVLVIAVKPDKVKSVLNNIKDVFSHEKILVTIAVGVPIKTYNNILGKDIKIFRTIPNLPLSIGEGMTLMAYKGKVTQEEIKFVKTLFGCAGKVEELEEKYISGVTALTSSSPAYVFMFIEAMATSLMKIGILSNKAYEIAATTVLGSARIMADSITEEKEFKEIMSELGEFDVESFSAFDKDKLKDTIKDAMNACNSKSRDIGQI